MTRRGRIDCPVPDIFHTPSLAHTHIYCLAISLTDAVAVRVLREAGEAVLLLRAAAE